MTAPAALAEALAAHYRLDRQLGEGGMAPVDEALRIAIEVADAIDYAQPTPTSAAASPAPDRTRRGPEDSPAGSAEWRCSTGR
jgi:hypothetical protein